MKTRGKIQSIFKAMTGGFIVTLHLPECRYEELVLLEPEDLAVELSKWRERRSLDANAYFHVLVGKMAAKLKRSNIYIKNDMICKYGQIELIDGRMLTITTQLDNEKAMEQEFQHWKYYSIEYVRDRIFYNYIVMRGSHTYNTKEMSPLIDGTVQEAKELGIETLTPDEIERMKQQWQGKT